MSETMQLWIIVDDIIDRNRRNKIRSILSFARNQIKPGIYELVCSGSRMESLLREIASILYPDDNLRVYRSCANCRENAKIFGSGELSRPPAAIIV